MFRNFQKYKRSALGFTMVELLLVMTIISIFLVIGTLFLRSSRNFNNLNISQREVSSAIKASQNYALSGRVISDGETPCGYGTRFLSDTSYSIFYVPKSGSKSSCEVQNQDPNFLYCGSNGCTDVESFSLPRGIELRLPAPSSSAEIYFTIPHGNVYNYTGGSYSGQTWTLRSLNDNSEKSIEISPLGAINENQSF